MGSRIEEVEGVARDEVDGAAREEVDGVPRVAAVEEEARGEEVRGVVERPRCCASLGRVHSPGRCCTSVRGPADTVGVEDFSLPR